MLAHRVRHCLLALAFVFGTTSLAVPTAAQDAHAGPEFDSEVEGDTDVADERPPASGEGTELPRLKVHSVGVGYHSVFFRTRNGDRYAIHGPAVVYDYFVGRQFGFAIHGESYFPAVGRQSGESSFRGGLWGLYDDRHYGFDLTLMAAYRKEFSPTLTLFSGIGLHVQSFSLNGGAYAPIEVISMGAGFVSRLQWGFHPLLALNADLLVAFDPFDMIDHQNPSVIVVPVALSVGIGVRF